MSRCFRHTLVKVVSVILIVLVMTASQLRHGWSVVHDWYVGWDRRGRNRSPLDALKAWLDSLD